MGGPVSPIQAGPADRFDLQRALTVGLWTTAGMLPLLLAYPFVPGHAPIPLVAYLGLFLAAAVLAVLLGSLRRRLVAWASGRWPLYLWSVADIGLVSAGVAITGGMRSPLYLCYVLTSLFVTSCYSPRAQLGVLGITAGGYLGALVAAGGSLDAATLVLRAAVIGLVTALGASIANEKDRGAAEALRRAVLLAAVADAAREVSGAERSQVLEGVLEATEELGFEFAHLSVLDPGGTLQLLRARGISEAVLAKGLKPHLGMMGLVAREQSTVWLEDYSSHERAVPEFAAAGLTAVIGSPIVVDGQLVGVLAAGSKRQRRLSPEDREAFELLAGVASRAFEGARRFEQLAEREARMRHMALHDELTGLANRLQLNGCIDEALVGKASRLALLVFDLDDFKRVNDTLGHAAGDELLVNVATRIGACVDEGATVARLSGDEFGILVPDLDKDGVEDLARRLLVAVSEPTRVGHRQMTVRASIGIATTTAVAGGPAKRSARADQLLREADVAMYEAKRAGKGCYVVFDTTMSEAMTTRLTIENELLQAIDSGEMTVVYQPIFDLATEAVTGFEALVRWQNPRLGEIPPAEFIPIAEESGAIVPLGRWVLRQACEQLQVLRQARPDWSQLGMSVNLSTRQLRDPGLVEDLLVILAETWVPSWCLTLEITESSLLQDAAACEDKLQAMAALGIAVALDDFGTGYSSLSYLRQLKVHALKIDRSFVEGLAGGAKAVALVRSVVNLGDALGLGTVAEGIETPAQLEALRQLGCTRAQGYLLARPLPADHLLDFLAAREVLGTALPPFRAEPEAALEGR